MPEVQKTPRTAPASLSNESDEALMLRFRNHDDIGAFESLVHRYERPLYNYLLRYLRNAELAEEAFQGAFSRVHQKRDLYTEGRRFRPWLYSIATNQAIDEIRREGRHEAASLEQRRSRGDAETGTTLLEMLEAETPSPYEQLEASERRDWTRRAVDDLPEHLRTVVLLVYFQGLKYREAAEVLEIPVGTVKSRLNTALGMLNTAWRVKH
ncbi:MAG: sigma-70 family RNA polymerase sigma factor [Planctomycetes bacterium]|nr:sigma-70 family RNA polymerase sigma factor [Planctomycetota bacterium]